MGGDVAPGVEDAPDVEAVLLGHVEDEVGEPLESPTPQLRDLQLAAGVTALPVAGTFPSPGSLAATATLR